MKLHNPLKVANDLALNNTTQATILGVSVIITGLFFILLTAAIIIANTGFSGFCFVLVMLASIRVIYAILKGQ